MLLDWVVVDLMNYMNDCLMDSVLLYDLVDYRHNKCFSVDADCLVLMWLVVGDW